MRLLIRQTLYLFLIFCVSITTSAKERSGEKISISKGWFIKSSTQVKEDGTVISNKNFQQEKWYPADIPSSVLGALIKNGVYPDTRVGMNEFLIPDVSDEFNAKHDLAKYSYLKDKRNPWKDPYWFRKEFEIPDNYKRKHIWLNFDGINYRADVWLNGKKIADKEEVVGMFCRYKFDITASAKAGEKNYLAVKIYQCDNPGTPNPGVQVNVFGPGRGWSTDIFKDETLKFSGGWDCAPVVRDRNMGIYQDVFITATGDVNIEDPYIITDLQLPDTTKAYLTISTDIKNNSGKKIKGVLKGEIELVNKLEFPTYTKILPGKMSPVVFQKEVEIDANKTTTIELNNKDIEQLIIKNPHLWWPNGYGNQYLHKLNLTFEIDNKISDKKEVTFGIRKITNDLKKIQNEYGRVFYINGKRVFCKGGWIQSEILQDTDKKRAYNEARLLAEANVNMIANEDAPAPPEYIMETYDKYGLMIWETFYQCWRMYPGSETANYPVDHSLALKNARDIMKRYRNHPSLVLWCVACETTVCEDIYVPLRQIVKELDNTRPFLPTSSYDWDVDKLTPYMKADLPLGMTDAGAPDYNWNPETYYFQKVLEVEKQTFRNELGVPSIPTYSSLKKFMPRFSADKSNPIYPLDSVWAHHGAWDGENYAFRGYDNAIRTMYGFPSSIEDYARKAQYVNANSYRAMFEAANHRMWDITSGVMLWKLNDCWPSVLWQLYDWYQNPNAAYYFAKKGMEPVHIQMNANDYKVSIINAQHKDKKDLIATADIYDFNMKNVWSRSEDVTIEQDRYKEVFTIPQLKNITDVYFVKLELKEKNGVLISDNFYWLSSKNPIDFSMLSKLEAVDLKVSVKKDESEKEFHFTVTIENPTDKLSFFNRFIITKGKNGEEVLPVFWDDNYITLLPKETRTLKVTIAKEDLNGAEPVISIDRSGVINTEQLQN